MKFQRNMAACNLKDQIRNASIRYEVNILNLNSKFREEIKQQKW
jgi:hypothetical protein